MEPQQQTMDLDPTFSIGTSFVFNGKKYHQKPVTKGMLCKALCCPLCCPLEDKYYENKDEYISFRTQGCDRWPCCESYKIIINHDKKDVGEVVPAHFCENGCLYPFGLKCSGEVILASIKVDGQEKYTMRQFLECCGCLWACLEKPCCVKCCFKPTWHVLEQPIYGPRGTEAKSAGFIKTISHNLAIQDVMVCVDGASVDDKITLTAIPWLTITSVASGAAGGSFLDPGMGQNTLRNLHINRATCSFEQMLGSTHHGEHVPAVKGAVTYGK